MFLNVLLLFSCLKGILDLISSKTKVRLAYSLYLEEHGSIQEARDAYDAILARLPGNLETIVKKALFEFRQGSLKDADAVFDSAISSAQDKDSKGFLVTQKIRLAFTQSRNVDNARQGYKTAIKLYGSNKTLWYAYLMFEMNVLGCFKCLTDRCSTRIPHVTFMG